MVNYKENEKLISKEEKRGKKRKKKGRYRVYGGGC